MAKIEESKQGEEDEELRLKFNKLDQKTIDLTENTIQHINSTLTFLTCENSTLQGQIQKMQKEIENESKMKKEFHSEFQAIKKNVEMVQKWEEEAASLRVKNDWLQTQLHKLNQRHNKVCLQTYNQLINIKSKFNTN